MKRKLTKKEKKAKANLEIEKYKSAYITPLYKDNEVVNGFDNDKVLPLKNTNVSDFNKSLTYPSNPSLSLRKAELAMFELQLAIGDREFNSQADASKFVDNFISKVQDDKFELSLFDSTPYVIAQRIMYEAFREKTRKKKVSLAKKALKIYDKCCDAYNVLAEESDNYDDALNYYENGVEAGEAILIDYEPKAPLGEYWMDIKLRPYLRSLVGLADMLWEIGLHEKSVDISSYLLDINTTDNLGIRFIFAYRLISLGRFKETSLLFKNYKEDSTLDTFFAHFLLNLKKNGIIESTKAAFKKAIEFNPFLIGFLLDYYKMPKKMPEYFTFGSKEEAALTIINFESAFLEDSFYANILLVSYLYVRDSSEHKDLPGATEKDFEVVNQMITILEDMINNPEKIKDDKNNFDQ